MRCRPTGPYTGYNAVKPMPQALLDRYAKKKPRARSSSPPCPYLIIPSHRHISKKDQHLGSGTQISKQNPKHHHASQPLLSPDVGVGGNNGEPTASGAFSAKPLILSLSASGKGFLPPWAAFLDFSLIRGTPWIILGSRMNRSSSFAGTLVTICL